MASNILIGYVHNNKQKQSFSYGVVRKADLDRVKSHFNPDNVIIAKKNIYEGVEGLY